MMDPVLHFSVQISHWHGFNIELWMTIGVVILGGLLFSTMTNWLQSAFYREELDIFNNGYVRGYEGLIKSSQFITGLQLTGRLRDYFVFMCTFILLIIGYTMYRYEAFAINTTNISPIDPYMWLLTIALVIAIVAVPFINNRMMALIVKGGAGYIIALMLDRKS